MMLSWTFSLLISFLPSAFGHSWVECSDYQADFSGQNYNFDDCKGFTRDYYTLDYAGSFHLQAEKSAGGGNQFECPQLFRNGASIEDHYNDEYPYAVYVPGNTYRIVWPAKNHGIGEECGESNTFDADMVLYVNPNVDPSSDLSDVSQATLVHDWHKEYLDANGLTDSDWKSWKGVDGVPFANCEDYCADTDASPCWGDFTVPTDMFTESGFYTFIWYWEFSTLFISCYEAYVDLDGTVVTTTTTTNNDNNDNGDSGNNDDTGDTGNNEGDPTPSPTQDDSGNDGNDGNNDNNDSNGDTGDDNNDNNNDNNDSNGDDNGDSGNDSNNDDNNNDSNNDNGDNNDDNNSGGSSTVDTEETVETATAYVFAVPVCVTDALYDESVFIGGLESLFSNDIFEGNEYEVTDLSMTFDEFNATVEITTFLPISVGVNLHNGSICEAIETAFSASDCAVCDEYSIHSETVTLLNEGNNGASNSGGSKNDNSALVWVIVALSLVIVLLGIGFAVYWFMFKDKNKRATKSRSETHENINAFVIANNATTTTTNGQQPKQAIAPVSEEGAGVARPTGAPTTGAAAAHAGPAGGGRGSRPPRPPPPRPPQRY